MRIAAQTCTTLQLGWNPLGVIGHNKRDRQDFRLFYFAELRGIHAHIYQKQANRKPRTGTVSAFPEQETENNNRKEVHSARHAGLQLVKQV